MDFNVLVNYRRLVFPIIFLFIRFIGVQPIPQYQYSYHTLYWHLQIKYVADDCLKQVEIMFFVVFQNLDHQRQNVVVYPAAVKWG